MSWLLRHGRRQEGYTLVELIIASAVGVIVMTGLTSVIFTSVQAGMTASSRVEASSQIRNFGLNAYDDFALSRLNTLLACTSACSTPITLKGLRASNLSLPTASNFTVTYTWQSTSNPKTLDRQVSGSPPVHAATGVTAFSWYVDGSSPNQTVVVMLTVTVNAYAESQTFRFHPRLVP